jgi:hypothetical protein
MHGFMKVKKIIWTGLVARGGEKSDIHNFGEKA